MACRGRASALGCSHPFLTLTKTIGSGGRQFSADQFIVNIKQGSTVVAAATTSGTATTVSTTEYQASAGTSYSFSEDGAGSTALDQYTSTMSCTNQWGSSSTSLPTTPGGAITPQYGDVISCTITNIKRTNNAQLSVTKVSIPISDPVNGTINPLMIPGAIVRYTIYVQNSGEVRPDNSSILIVDGLPSQLAVGTAASPVFTNGTPSSGLSFSTFSGIRYSNSATQPSTWAQCTYNPVSAYDPAVKFVCLRPTGRMNASSGTPPNFSISIEGQIK
jgi:uncharacterized repeat protein (TIGR01451 family)